MTDTTHNTRARILEHEAAHVLAAINVCGAVNEVRLIPPNTTHPLRKGALAETDTACLTDGDDARVNLAGYVWACLEGNPDMAASDLEKAEQYQRQAGVCKASFAAEVCQFVHDHAAIIRTCAEKMLAAMPKSGRLRGDALRRVLDDIRPMVPKRRQPPGPNATCEPCNCQPPTCCRLTP